MTTGYVALSPAADCGRDENAKPRARNRTNVALFMGAPKAGDTREAITDPTRLETIRDAILDFLPSYRKSSKNSSSRELNWSALSTNKAWPAPSKTSSCEP